jgi:uncharacterized protein YaiL (DUF2058 family)
MSTSLRDQLIQAGLVTKKQAKLASQQQPRPPQQSRRKPPRIPEHQLAAQRAQAQKAARDQELNRKQQAKAERTARLAQVRQLIEQNRVPPIESEDFYNFIDGTKIKRICVNAPIREQLNRGELRIVRCDNRYALVSASAGERIAERDPAALIARVADTAAAAGADGHDNVYGAYVVPDDLMW